jgi:hypothetical protein
LGKSYEEIADTLFLSVSYINKDGGYRLWKKLSAALGEEVTKNGQELPVQDIESIIGNVHLSGSWS